MKTSIFQNSNKNIVRISSLKVFIASLGLPGSILGLSLDLVGRKPTGSPKSFQKAPRKVQKFQLQIQGRNPMEIISFVFWKKLSFHKDIIELNDL